MASLPLYQALSPCTALFQHLVTPKRLPHASSIAFPGPGPFCTWECNAEQNKMTGS